MANQRKYYTKLNKSCMGCGIPICDVAYRCVKCERGHRATLQRTNSRHRCIDCGKYLTSNAFRCRECWLAIRKEINTRGYVATYLRNWRRKNPEKARLSWARRDARKKALPATLTPAQAERLFAIGQAMYPGEELHLDHVVPLSAGGGFTRANIHAIPAWLNMLKRNALPQEVYRQIKLQLFLSVI